jgi:hypothetical protein
VGRQVGRQVGVFVWPVHLLVSMLQCMHVLALHMHMLIMFARGSEEDRSTRPCACMCQQCSSAAVKQHKCAQTFCMHVWPHACCVGLHARPAPLRRAHQHNMRRHLGSHPGTAAAVTWIHGAVLRSCGTIGSQCQQAQGDSRSWRPWAFGSGTWQHSSRTPWLQQPWTGKQKMLLMSWLLCLAPASAVRKVPQNHGQLPWTLLGHSTMPWVLWICHCGSSQWGPGVSFLCWFFAWTRAALHMLLCGISCTCAT